MTIYYCRICSYGRYSYSQDLSSEIQNAKKKCRYCSCTPLADAIRSNAPDDIILKLLAANEEAAKAHDMNGALPLNRAIENKLSDEVILALLAANENATKIQDKKRTLPLTLAIQFKLSDEVILALLAANTDAVKSSSVYGKSPLELAIQEKHSDEVILALLAANEDISKSQVAYRSHRSKCSLHLAIQYKSSERVILSTLKANKNAAKINNYPDFLPLHQAVKNNLSDEVILALLDANRDASKEKDRSGDLVLHAAINYKLSDKVILSLLQANKDAAKHFMYYNNEQILPLHTAIEQSYSDTVILAILTANEDAAKQPDRKGCLPVRKAIEKVRSDQVILALLKANKNAVQNVQRSSALNINYTPLITYAMDKKSSDNVILALLIEVASCNFTGCNEKVLKAIIDRKGDEFILQAVKASSDKARHAILCNILLEGTAFEGLVLSLIKEYPQLSTITCVDGNLAFGVLPLHKAIDSNISENVILALLAANQDAAKARDQKKLLPLHKAIRFNLSDKVLLAILKANKDASKDMNGVLPLHMAIEEKRSCDVILTLLEANKDATHIRDQNKILPLHRVIDNYRLSKKVVMATLAANSNAAKDTDRNGILPLQKALAFKLPDEVIFALLAANEVAALKLNTQSGTTTYDQSLVHYALDMMYSNDVVKALLVAVARNQLPGYCKKSLKVIIEKRGENLIFEAARETSNKVRHSILWGILLERCGSDKLILFLVSHFPSITQVKDTDGIMALHLALKMKHSAEVVLSIMEANKAAVLLESSNGVLPLHQAIQNHYSENVTLGIFSAYPLAAMIRCKQTGMLPLHLAASSSSSPLLIETLIRENPEALDTEVNHFFPRDLVTSALPSDSIKMLWRPYMEWKKILSFRTAEVEEVQDKMDHVKPQNSEISLLSEVLTSLYKNVVVLNEKIDTIESHLLKTSSIHANSGLKTDFSRNVPDIEPCPNSDACKSSIFYKGECDSFIKPFDKTASVQSGFNISKLVVKCDDSNDEKVTEDFFPSVDATISSNDESNMRLVVQKSAFSKSSEENAIHYLSSEIKGEEITNSGCYTFIQSSFKNHDGEDKHVADDTSLVVDAIIVPNVESNIILEGQNTVYSDSMDCQSLVAEASSGSSGSAEIFNSFVFIGNNLAGKMGATAALNNGKCSDGSLGRTNLAGEVHETSLSLSSESQSTDSSTMVNVTCCGGDKSITQSSISSGMISSLDTSCVDITEE